MSREEVLFANEAFYQAFADGDVAAMAALWAEELPIACLHPGAEPVSGREAVMASWQAVLREPPPVACRGPKVYETGPDGAFVICWEEVGGGFLIATNIFARERGQWRMVHHQAGPIRGRPKQLSEEEDRRPPTIN